MDRRGFLLGATALLAVGCARVPPPAVSGSPSPVPAQTPLNVGRDDTATSAVLAQLLATTIAAKGRPVEVESMGESWRAALGHGDLAAVPAFAGTLWAAQSQNAAQPDELPARIASLLAPDISVLNVPQVNGELVWRVTQKTAESGIGSLSRIGAWSKGKTAAVGPLAMSRADGVPSLKTVYGAQFTYTEVGDPIERANLLTQGEVAMAVFRSTDYTGASGLVDLVDTEKVTLADPAVILVNKAFTEADPERVLAIDQLAKTLTTDTVIDLQAQVAAGGSLAEVAERWLGEEGID